MAGWRDWIPPALARKASAVTRLVVMVANKRAVMTPNDYGRMAREGYQQNIWVYRCVNELAKGVAGLDWLMYQDPRTGRGRIQELPGHPALQLLRRPNPEQGKRAFFESYVGFMGLSGNGYLEVLTGDLSGLPRELWPVRPDRMRVVPDAKNRVGGYIYTLGGREVAWDRDHVMHTKLFNPLDDWYGMSPIQAAAYAIDHDNESSAYDIGLLRNMAVPSGALVSQGELSDKSFTRLEKMMEEDHQGADNAGKPLVLDGGLDWKAMGLSPQDLAIIESQKWNATRICSAFGVPIEVVGLGDTTYANKREARKGLYEEAIIPLAELIRDDLNSFLVPRYGERLRLDFDRDRIPALQEDQDKKWLRVNGATFLTVNEKRAAMDYEELPEGDVILVPATQVPLEEAGMAPEAPDADPVDFDPDTDPDPKEGKGRRQVKAFNLVSEKAKKAEWKAQDRLRRSWEKRMAAVAAGMFRQEADAVVKAIREGDALLPFKEEPWVKRLEAAYTNVAEDFGDRTLEGLKAEGAVIEVKTFEAFRTEMLAVIKSVVAQRVRNILDTTKDKVREAIEEGMAEEETFPEIADRVKAVYDGFTEKRAMTIARTEVLTASSIGNRYAAKEAGVPLVKEWVPTPDHRTRSHHRNVTPKQVDFDQPYIVGGAPMMYPGDPSGGAKNVVNCRCIEVYHFKQEDE